jgi:hypothetical protein
LLVHSLLYRLLNDSISLVEINQGQPISAKCRARGSLKLSLRGSLRCWRGWARYMGGHRDRGLLELENPLPIVLGTDALP